jgi:alkanesulfonate monooxygenase SsuD/methylene tetrahydromethanopterin reductase-like flavin-dependent oxidoreductase (luciferase family)
MPADFIDRFGIVGSAEQCIERLRELAAFGVDRFVVSGPTTGADREPRPRGDGAASLPR